MQTFLSFASEQILATKWPLKDVAIVLPSQRAAVFMQRELSRQLEHPTFSPAFITIENLVLKSTGLEAETQPALLFKLYEAYAASVKQADSFAEFSKWGQLLLADFNEVDRYLVDSEKLFNYLADVKRIEKWNLEAEPGELITNYLKFWQSLPAVYQSFKKTLLAEGRVHQGLAYRLMAEDIENISKQLKEQYQQLFFVGFNALNQAEEEILLTLYEKDLATYYWDVDTYYFQNEEHEAGQFLRASRLVKRLQQRDAFYGLHSALNTHPQKIEVTAVSGNQLQGVTANTVLNGYKDQNWENTALVLADEELLPAVLNNLNQEIPELNLTMGLPLAQSPYAGFFNLLLDFQRNFERKQRSNKKGEALFHHQLWDDLLGNLVYKRMSDSPFETEQARQQIRRRNLVYASYAQLLELGLPETLPAALFEPAENLSAYFKILANFCEKTKNKLAERQTEMLFGFFQLFNQLSQLFEKYPYVEDAETARYFFRDLLSQVTVDLIGEPLSGLQIMGMLETRTLDFKNVIITSLNEDILPKGRSQNSLIPFDLKREYGLPTYLDKDAVYAYHFYRLLQRAENVHLLYNTASSGMKVGEASRFIAQVEIELAKHHRLKTFASKFIRSSAAGKPTVDAEGAKKIEKTPAIMQRLHQMAEKGISPTALREYLVSPIDFYYHRVLQLEEADEVEEEADFRIQGIVLHELLERFYEPLLQNQTRAVADTEHFSLSRKELQDLVEAELQEKLNSKHVDQGRNLLTLELLTGMLHNFLQMDAQRINTSEQGIRLLGLEQNLETKIKLPQGTVVKIHGSADRIEREGDTIRIIDYKTGGDQSSDFSLTGEMDQLLKKPKAIQLLIYGLLYMKNQPAVEKVFPIISSLRNPERFIDLKIKQKAGMNQEVLMDFEAYLIELLSEIFNPEFPFSEQLVLE